MASSVSRASHAVALHRCGVILPRATNRSRASVTRASGTTLNNIVSLNDTNSPTATTALSLTASAAASALLAKVTATVAIAGVAPGVLMNLYPSTLDKVSENTLPSSSTNKSILAEKIAVAPAPTAASPAPTLPADWLFVTSAAEWLEQNRQAAAGGALLATVFVSDKAARAHGPLFDRLRRNYGTGPSAPVRFVFVHIADDYAQRNDAAAGSTTLARGPQGLTLGRLSHSAALHGLDVALTSFLPDGVRAFPSLLLTTGGTTSSPGAGVGGGCDGAGAHWAAATRIAELTQLVSDWAFINRRSALKSKMAPALVSGVVGAAATAAAAATVVPVPGSTRRVRLVRGAGR